MSDRPVAGGSWAIAEAAARDAGWVRPTVEEYVDAQYTGAKAAHGGGDGHPDRPRPPASATLRPVNG